MVVQVTNPNRLEDNMICSNCGIDKELSCFYPRNNRKKKYTSWCKDCLKVHRDKYAKRARVVRRCRMFNITEYELNELYRIHDSKCAICGIRECDTKKGSLCVDHDHKSGKVRGLLCDDCNVGIGRLKDSTENLNNAIKYLQKYEI